MISRFKIKKHYLGKEDYGNSMFQEQQQPPQADIAKLMKDRRSHTPDNPSNNILPFDRKQTPEKLPKPQAQNSQPTELPAFITNIPKGFVDSVARVPETIKSKTRPGLVQFDDTIEDWFLHGPAKFKSLLSGIGGFFKSIPALFGANTKGKK